MVGEAETLAQHQKPHYVERQLREAAYGEGQFGYASPDVTRRMEDG